MRVYTTGSLPQHILSGNMSHFGGTAHQSPPRSLLTVVNSALFVLLTTIYEASAFKKACQKLINFVHYLFFFFYFAIL